MKIKDMTSKTSLEVEDTDLLVIEDAEDTKSITVGEFKTLLNLASNENTKKIAKTIVNETIDNVISSLSMCKYIISELKTYMINTWIGSTSGNIQIAIKDMNNDKWLTAQDMVDMMSPGENGIATKDFVIKAKVAGAFETAVSYSIRDFNTEHLDAINVNKILSTNNAGFIKAHFDNLTQNEIAGITYDDISVTFPESEEYRYLFIADENSFANAVPYIEKL